MSRPKKPGKRRGPRKGTVALSELGVMLDGPGPFDNARVLADMPVRADDRSDDKITSNPKAKHSKAKHPKKRP